MREGYGGLKARHEGDSGLDIKEGWMGVYPKK